MRWIRRFFFLCGLLVVVGIGSAWLLLHGSLARLDGKVSSEHLSARVSINRDALGTATIDANDRIDLSWALGFLHAQERYFQMDLMRRLAAGELSELFGKQAIELDRGHRMHRFRARATESLARMPPADRALIDAYREGVNAGLADLSVRPWEYLLLRQTPQPWRSEDTALVIDAMFLDLNSDGANLRELNLARLRAALPAPVYRFLIAPGSSWDAPLRGDALAAEPLPGADVLDLRNGTWQLVYNATELHQSVTDSDGLRNGSNNFAVGGALVAGGAALVSNDMHLGLRVPNIWYRARLRYPDPDQPGASIDLNGVTLPGTPALTAGSNGHIAWGYTNSYGDWTDWVRVQRDPEQTQRYRTANGWETIAAHTELLHVRDEPDQSLIVEDTQWGPIMASDTDGTPLALAWTAHDPRALNLRLIELERTHDVQHALDLAPGFGMPAQNFVVGDEHGHIGWTLTGNAIPRREGFDPLLPADFSTPGVGWNGWLEPTAYPRVYDPENHRLWTANARTVDGDWLRWEGDGGYDLGARALQIRDDLLGKQQLSASDMLAVQLDDRAVFLERWHALLQTTLATAQNPALVELQSAAKSWSARAAIDSIDYRLVRSFRSHVVDAVLAPFAALARAKSAAFELPSAQGYEAAVWTLLQIRPMHLLDPRYADWNALLLDAATKVAEESGGQGKLASQTWGERNTAAIRHPLSRALPNFIARWIDMPAQSLPGDSNMPRVQSPGFGASERFTIEPGHEDRSYLMMPGGQSGNPLSPFHAAGHDDWVIGRATPLLPGPSLHRLTLEPATSG
ncbi:MAG: penicillin acylase family protein [Tahibacter sp.]